MTLPPGRARLATKPCTHGVPNARHHDGDGSSRSLRRQRRWSSCDHDQINLKTNQVRRKLRQALILLLGKPVLDGDILSLDPAKLAQLLPERLQEDRATGSSAIIQETYAEDFSCLLRVTWINGRQKQGCKYEDKKFVSHRSSDACSALTVRTAAMNSWMFSTIVYYTESRSFTSSFRMTPALVSFRGGAEESRI